MGMNADSANKHQADKKAKREQRLAEALRANLRRRKTAARNAVSADGAAEDSSAPAEPKPDRGGAGESS